MRPRVLSLLPSATEIVCAVGAREQLVGISHECDHPGDLAGLPVLTAAKFAPAPTSAGIDDAVRAVVRDALAVYDIDTDLLARVDPDVVVTQDLCDVCAVSMDDVRAAVAGLTRDDVTVVSLRPRVLADVWEDIRRTGRGIGREAEAEAVVRACLDRVEAVRARAADAATRPRVLTIEWLAPIMLGGMWMPEMIELAGGTPLVTAPGDHAPTLDLAALAALDPEVVLVKPCGFDLDRTREELGLLVGATPWESWTAAREGRVYVADGNAYFNRPGPRIVESLEILAACLHPGLFPEHRERHAAEVVRLRPDGTEAPFAGPAAGGS